MKLTREMKAAINRRVYQVARSAMLKWAVDVRTAVEADEVAPDEIATWWPDELDPNGQQPPEWAQSDMQAVEADPLAGF